MPERFTPESPQQKERRPVQPELILTVPLEKIRPSMPKDLHPITPIDLPETRQKKTKEVIRAAYEFVRIGGTLGTSYELSTKHVPHRPADFFQGKPLRADCDEMILAIVAAARAYGVDMKDISVLDFDITAKFKDGVTQMTMGHAVAITLNEGMFLFDPAFGFKGIPLKDKTPETLDAVYKGQKVLDGSYTIVGVDRKNTPAELTDEKQIASLYYHDLGVYHQINGKNGQTAAEAFETAYLLGKAEEDKKLMIEGLRGLFDESTKVKDFRTAEMYVRKMLQYDDNRPEYLMRLGKTLSTLGKSDEAIDAFDKIISIEPKNGSAYAYKSELLRKSGQTDQAIKILESAVAFGIKSPDIFLELTFLYNSSGDPQNLIKTINICTTWENLVPMDPAIFVKESYSYFKLAGHARKKAEESGDYGEVARLLRLSINSADNGLKYAPEGSEEFIALTSTRKSALDASNAIKK